MTYDLEARDREILRTLLRVRFLTTREINSFFFDSPRVGRRRLHKLSERDYIKPHSKGLPPRCPYSAWRLTTKGVEAVERSFPSEPIPDGLIERLAEQSLYNLDHREGIARIYMSLISAKPPAPEEGTPHAITRRWIAGIQARANQLVWHPDGDVVLSYKQYGKNHYAVPDATIVGARRKVRIFLEFDRSTKPLGRIKDDLKFYREYLDGIYEQDYRDGLVPWVFYVVGSEARRQSIYKVAKDTFLARPVNFKACRHDVAREWLEEHLLDATQPAAEPKPASPRSVSPATVPASEYEALKTSSSQAYAWVLEFFDVLHVRGVMRPLRQANPTVLNRGTECLAVLYDQLAQKVTP